MIEGITVLSLFDGMSCGQIALERAGIKVKKYFAAEVDKQAIKVTQHNYPNTIQIGDVTKVRYNNGVLYTEKGDFEVGKIDLLIGGSPCQSFSSMGNGTGFDGKSGLFFEWLRIKSEVQPLNFILENVKMKQQWQDTISGMVGVKPMYLNSSLFSAQNRPRLYWSSSCPTDIVEDKGLLIKDILDESEPVDDSLYLHNRNIKGTLAVKKVKGNTRGVDRKMKCLTAGGQSFSNSGATIIQLPTGILRAPTPEECERAQTVPVGYTAISAKTNRYKMLGNGWTVDVIVHLLKGMDLEKETNVINTSK